jgi:hypothetical protein
MRVRVDEVCWMEVGEFPPSVISRDRDVARSR